MTPQQFHRVKELFAALEPLSAQARQSALEHDCADDPVIRAELEKLLAQNSDAQDKLSHLTDKIDRILAPIRASSDQLIGQRVGCYELVSVLGQGGMGVVYLGRDLKLGRKAALKAVLPGEQEDPFLIERLRREARVLASLSHPNIATVYGLEESHGTLFIAMEYIEGKTLSQKLGRNPLPISDALNCCEQIAAGLEEAHDAGVIHRDLKPANAMCTADGTIKVLDFGLARAVGQNAPARANKTTHPDNTRLLTLTRQGSFFGTPAYMSPEQARGEALDRRSDIYSFGSILFRCLTGRPAFEGETDSELIEAILAHEPDWSLLPAKLPQSVHSILRRCLAKDPADRYRNIGDVRLDLREARVARQWERRDPRPTTGALVRRLIPWAIALVAIAFGTSRFWSASHDATSTAGAVQRFDVAFPGNTVQGDLERVQLALSPDGRDLVIACKTKEGQALWMRSHNDGQWRRIEQTDGAHRPSFSQDGQWINFFRAGHLYKRRLTGQGDLIHLAVTTNWYGATWSGDGSFIYSSAWGDPLQKLRPGESSPHACTKLDAGEVSHVSPMVVPQSRWLMYNVWQGGEECAIHATHLDSGEKHVVASNASSPHIAQTPRGDYLLFERASIIFAAPFDRATARITGPEHAIAEGVLNDGTRFAAYFDVADDGTLVYFPGSSFAEESRISFVNPDGTTTPINDDRMSFSEPAYSPGGKKLAVGIKAKVYRSIVYDLERGTRENMLTGGDTLSHAISPDGQTLACTVNRDNGYGIDLVSLTDGRRLRRIVQPGADYQSDLQWSADGKYIVFTMSPQEGSARDVWTVELTEGATPRPIVHTTGGEAMPAISPDVKWLAYASDVSGRSEIYLTTFPNGQVTRQISNGGGSMPSWSPDGTKIYFVSPQGLVSVELSTNGSVTGKPKVVYDKPFGQSDPLGRDYTIAPDGRPLIIEPSERRPTVSHLRVITNWWKLL